MSNGGYKKMSLPIKTLQHLAYSVNNLLPGDQITVPIEIIEDLLIELDKTTYELEEANNEIRYRKRDDY